MMQSAQDRQTENATSCLDSARYRLHAGEAAGSPVEAPNKFEIGRVRYFTRLLQLNVLTLDGQAQGQNNMSHSLIAADRNSHFKVALVSAIVLFVAG
jgi:hypothetical protein